MTTRQCTGCAELQARLERALQERDEALLELARAHEELNRRELAAQWRTEETPPAYPLEAGAAWPVPLRYRLVDKLNSWVKSAVPGAQRRARALARRGHER